ncbi:hypothetical protein L2E82_22921 [Cichorium intybus]|uniref:Uncharacterized protein n=1 Tax=Cichorium intybus TaxID=13427 RepID=A0ACB9DZ37_CICIN|nr:hypothetical protein L2E82_22921 [Cichorium intybus]
MEAFDQPKQQAEFELSQSSSRNRLSMENEYDDDNETVNDESNTKSGIDHFNNEETDLLKTDAMIRSKTTEVAIKDFSSGSYATIFKEECHSDLCGSGLVLFGSLWIWIVNMLLPSFPDHSPPLHLHSVLHDSTRIATMIGDLIGWLMPDGSEKGLTQSGGIMVLMFIMIKCKVVVALIYLWPKSMSRSQSAASMYGQPLSYKITICQSAKGALFISRKER